MQRAGPVNSEVRVSVRLASAEAALRSQDRDVVRSHSGDPVHLP